MILMIFERIMLEMDVLEKILSIPNEIIMLKDFGKLIYMYICLLLFKLDIWIVSIRNSYLLAVVWSKLSD